MRVLLAVLFFSFLSLKLTLTARAEDTTEKANGIIGIPSNLSKFLHRIPGDYGKVVKTYLETLRPEEYTDDHHVSEANMGLREHFKESLDKDPCFLKLAEHFYADSEIKALDPKRGTNRPYIDDKLTEQKPGWIWKKALDVSGQNPNLAMKLIALCGHDDVGQEAAYKPKSNCPFRTSHFYFPEGLGDGVDTPEPIKKILRSAYSPNDKIWSKQYHIYGSAYLGCRMIENGVKPSSLPNYTEKFAYAYRRITGCQQASKIITESQFDAERYERQMKEFKRGGEIGQEPIFDSKGHYYAAKLYTTLTKCPGTEASAIEEIVAAATAKLNSGFTIMPSYLEDQCPVVVGSHCKDAMKVIDQWEADFKFTMAQHRVGAEFAAKHCKTQKELEKLPPPPICRENKSGETKPATGTK
jgi:hypothetical protein